MTYFTLQNAEDSLRAWGRVNWKDILIQGAGHGGLLALNLAAVFFCIDVVIVQSELPTSAKVIEGGLALLNGISVLRSLSTLASLLHPRGYAHAGSC